MISAVLGALYLISSVTAWGSVKEPTPHIHSVSHGNVILITKDVMIDGISIEPRLRCKARTQLIYEVLILINNALCRKRKACIWRDDARKFINLRWQPSDVFCLSDVDLSVDIFNFRRRFSVIYDTVFYSKYHVLYREWLADTDIFVEIIGLWNEEYMGALKTDEHFVGKIGLLCSGIGLTFSGRGCIDEWPIGFFHLVDLTTQQYDGADQKKDRKPFSKLLAAILPFLLLSISLSLCGYGVYQSCEVGGWAVWPIVLGGWFMWQAYTISPWPYYPT